LEKDFDELAHPMKEQEKAIMPKHGAELASKLMHINKHLNDVVDLANKMSYMKKPSNDNANMYPPPDPIGSPVVSPRKPSNPLESTRHASTYSAPIAPEESTKGLALSPPPIAPEVSTKGPVPSPPPIPPEESTKDPIPSPPLILLDESTKGLIPSPLPIPTKGEHKRSSTLQAIKPFIYSIDDIPSFSLFQPDDREYEDVYGERSRSPMPIGKHS